MKAAASHGTAVVSSATTLTMPMGAVKTAGYAGAGAASPIGGSGMQAYADAAPCEQSWGQAPAKTQSRDGRRSGAGSGVHIGSASASCPPSTPPSPEASLPGFVASRPASTGNACVPVEEQASAPDAPDATTARASFHARIGRE